MCLCTMVNGSLGYQNYGRSCNLFYFNIVIKVLMIIQIKNRGREGKHHKYNYTYNLVNVYVCKLHISISLSLTPHLIAFHLLSLPLVLSFVRSYAYLNPIILISNAFIMIVTHFVIFLFPLSPFPYQLKQYHFYVLDL